MFQHRVFAFFLVLAGGLVAGSAAVAAPTANRASIKTGLTTRIQNIQRVMQQLDACISVDQNHFVMYDEKWGCTVVTKEQVVAWAIHMALEYTSENASPQELARQVDISLSVIALQSKKTVAALRIVRANMLNDLNSTKAKLAGLRQPPPPKPASNTLPPPKPTGAQCPLGSWTNAVSNGASSIWTMKADYTATESGLGNASGSYTFDGSTLHISWVTGLWKGTYDVALDRDCRKGSGTIHRRYNNGPDETQSTTFTRGGSAPPTSATADVAGSWTLVCCSKKYRIGVTLKGTNDHLSGNFGDGTAVTSGTVEGDSVHFHRDMGGGAGQDYDMTLEDGGRTMTGSFSGNRDTTVGVETTMTQ